MKSKILVIKEYPGSALETPLDFLNEKIDEDYQPGTHPYEWEPTEIHLDQALYSAYVNALSVVPEGEIRYFRGIPLTVKENL